MLLPLLLLHLEREARAEDALSDNENTQHAKPRRFSICIMHIKYGAVKNCDIDVQI